VGACAARRGRARPALVSAISGTAVPSVPVRFAHPKIHNAECPGGCNAGQRTAAHVDPAVGETALPLGIPRRPRAAEFTAKRWTPVGNQAHRGARNRRFRSRLAPPGAAGSTLGQPLNRLQNSCSVSPASRVAFVGICEGSSHGSQRTITQRLCPQCRLPPLGKRALLAPTCVHRLWSAASTPTTPCSSRGSRKGTSVCFITTSSSRRLSCARI